MGGAGDDLIILRWIVTDKQKRKSPDFSGPSDQLQLQWIEIWYPVADSNRCRRRERAVSWAGLDERDSNYPQVPAGNDPADTGVKSGESYNFV